MNQIPVLIGNVDTEEGKHQKTDQVRHQVMKKNEKKSVGRTIQSMSTNSKGKNDK